MAGQTGRRQRAVLPDRHGRTEAHRHVLVVPCTVRDKQSTMPTRESIQKIFYDIVRFFSQTVLNNVRGGGWERGVEVFGHGRLLPKTYLSRSFVVHQILKLVRFFFPQKYV